MKPEKKNKGILLFLSVSLVLILMAGGVTFFILSGANSFIWLESVRNEAERVQTTESKEEKEITAAVSMSDSEIELGKALTFQLSASGGNQIVFHSSDESVATVDECGLVTGVCPGECQVTAENEYGCSAGCKVSVKKVCYLTIDDGPTDSTESILAVLKEYDVRATFFVVSSSRLYLTHNMEEQGCAVSLHSYSHIFKQCYSTEYSYFCGIDMLSDIVEEYTGKRPKMIRFPGGVTNTRCEPVWMVRMLNGAYDMGYQVYDWTASAGDTSAKASADFSYQNIRKTCTEDEEIILMHDRYFTPEALRRIIPYLRKEGYTFATLDEYPHGSCVEIPQYRRSHEDVPATSVELNHEQFTVRAGEYLYLIARRSPYESTDYIRWESSDTGVATVRADGSVYGVSKGTADISAIASSGVRSVCRVTITE